MKMSKRIQLSVWLTAIVAVATLSTPSYGAINLPLPGGPVSATKAWSFSFKDFNTAEGPADNLGPQLQLYVYETAADSGRINFMFLNNVGIASSVKEVFFSDGAYLAPQMQLAWSSGVLFETKPDGQSLDHPNQMNNVWPNTTAYVGAQGDLSPEFANGNPNGINVLGEYLTVSFVRQSGKTFDNVINGLRTNESPQSTGDPLFQIALHVGSIGATGGSDAYTLDGTSGQLIPDGNTGGGDPEPNPVPEPATLAIWSLGLGLVGLVRLRRKA